ncbi:MAG: AzlC family ABC transporter permease [Simkania sp.]|nr:AzlC family ABC transporter permease [Simkania sp.]
MVRLPFLTALKDSVATFFAYFPLGIVFGILFVTELSLPWYLAPLMSLLVLAGAIQFVAIGIFAAHGSILGFFITSLFVALRNSFYGLSVLHRYEKVSFWPRQYLIFGLVDAPYSIVQHHGERKNEIPYLFHLTWVIHFYWVSGTFIGAYFGKGFFQIPGLEFSLTALFTVFFIEQWKKCKDLSIALVALLGFGLGVIFFHNQAFIFGILITLFYICLRFFLKESKKS